MPRTRNAAAEYATISGEDMARFHRNAPAALARRGRAFVAESLAGALELLVLGGVPIVGMLRFDWSSSELLVFLLVGAWTGILCDLARLALAEAAVLAFGKRHYDDWHVWVIVDALRRGKTEAPKSHLQARWDPWSGVFVDLVTGVVATIVMGLLLRAVGLGREDGLAFDRTFVISLVIMVGYQVVTAAWEIRRHRREGEAAGPLKATPGIRGLGLFLLTGVMLIAGDPEGGGTLAAQRVMLVVNGAIVAAGVINAVGLLWLRGETIWLRNYMRQGPREGDVPRTKRAKKSNAKRN